MTKVRALRFLRLILGFYVFVWFNLVVPGHTRGIITIPGKGQETSLESSSCCSTKPVKTKDGKPTPAQQRQCAVCYVAATYTIPVVHTFHIDLLGLIQILHDRAISQLLVREYPTPFWPIGPPASA